jgi:hypothetical protein
MADTVDRLLRNELSSVETYRQALDRFRQDFLLRRAQAHVQRAPGPYARALTGPLRASGYVLLRAARVAAAWVRSFL